MLPLEPWRLLRPLTHGGATMTAECWGCAAGVSPVGTTSEPVGTCWVCGVWGCFGHAERDAGSLKWHCYPSVATAIAASAGLTGVTSETRFTSVREVQERFPIVMSELERHRAWTPGDVRGTLRSRLPEADTAQVNEPLLAVALDLGNFLLPAERDLVVGTEQRTILPTSLLVLLGRA